LNMLKTGRILKEFMFRTKAFSMLTWTLNQLRKTKVFSIQMITNSRKLQKILCSSLKRKTITWYSKVLKRRMSRDSMLKEMILSKVSTYQWASFLWTTVIKNMDLSRT
jgi:hypothetical protein